MPRIAIPSLSLLLLLTASSAQAGGVAFPAERFAQLETPTPADTARWDWPDDDDFEQVWSGPERGAAHAWLVVDGVLTDSGARVSVGVRRSGDGGLSFFDGSWAHRSLIDSARPLGDWSAARPGDTLSFDAEGITSLLVESVSAAGAPWGSAWDDWSYTTELLRSESPVYDIRREGKEEAGELAMALRGAMLVRSNSERGEQALTLARRLLDTVHPPSDDLWADAADFAASRDPALAIALRGRYWPRGRCSMDTAPQRAGMAFADLCYAAGDRACYLQLQVRVMGDAVGSRVMRSSYGEASFETYVGRIGEIGVDTERFLMGLVFAYDTDQPRAVGLHTNRLARAMIETGEPARYDALLASYAQDPSLDDLNRHQAATTLAWVRIRQHRDDPTRAEGAAADVLGHMRATMELAPMSERWVDAHLLLIEG